MAESDSRSRGLPIAVFWLLGAWVIVVIAALVWGVGNTETQLRAATRDALSGQNSAITVDVDGRDATLYGVVDSGQETDEVVALIDAIPGVRNVNSELVVVAPTAPEMVGPEVSFRIIGDVVSLRGSLPNPEIEAEILAAAREHYGEDRIVDAFDVSESVEDQPWLNLIKDVFSHLSALRSGGFVANEASLVLTGEVISEAVRDDINQELGLILANALPLTSNLSVAVLPTPTFFASGSGDVLRLEGQLPSRETADEIADAAARLYPGATIINSMVVAEVAGPAWLESISGLLDVATRLDPWTIDITAEGVTITGLSTDPELVGAIEILLEEVVGRQLDVSMTVEAQPAAVATQLTDLFRGSEPFEGDTATLSADGEALLDRTVEILQVSPSVRLVVQGHTDASGDAEANLELSRQWAEAVVAYLVAAGIAPDRLTAVGFGEDRPIADNVTEEGRSQNRRIEFVVEGEA